MKTTFKKPDLSAPRFRPSKHVVLTKELYKKFLKANPDYDITYENFKKIITTFNKNIVQGAIDNRSGIELPQNIGYVFLASCEKPKKQNIDIKKSTEYGVIANHKNWDSDNKLLKIFFVNKDSYRGLTYKNLWGFKPIRNFKRNASKAFIENYNNYISLDLYTKPSSLFNRITTKKYTAKEINSDIFSVIPEGYDEFNI
jgi:hypothetical protein